MRLADALVRLALVDGRSAPGWSEVRDHLTEAGHHDPETLILDGIRDGDAFARINDDNEWCLTVRWPAAREVLLAYASRRLEDAGIAVEDFDTYQGDDREAVVSLGIELAQMAHGDRPTIRPDKYRRLLRG